MQFCFSVGSNNSGSRRHLCEKENFQIKAFEIKAAAEKIKVTWTNKFKDTRTISKTWNLICLLLYFARLYVRLSPSDFKDDHAGLLDWRF